MSLYPDRARWELTQLRDELEAACAELARRPDGASERDAVLELAIELGERQVFPRPAQRGKRFP